MRTTVEAALRMGYRYVRLPFSACGCHAAAPAHGLVRCRHIDTAQMYGNHEPIGEVFGKVFSEGGSLERKDVWVTSKVR